MISKLNTCANSCVYKLYLPTSLYKTDAFTLTANLVFFSVNSIYNIYFVNHVLLNTIYPEKWGTLYAIFFRINDYSTAYIFFFR